MSQQPQQRYTLHLGAGQTMPVTLPTDEPIYRLIERLVYEHGLPTVDQHNQPVRYALYAGHTRRLSSEMSLSQAGYAQGGELYLANVNAPWWEQTTAATRRLQDHHSTSAPNDRRRLYALLGVGAAVVLTMGIVVAALILINSPNPRQWRNCQRQRPSLQGWLEARRHPPWRHCQRRLQIRQLIRQR